MNTIQEIIKCLEDIAPLGLQEGYDNAGLIIGDRNMSVKGVLLCLDSTEAVLDEAIATNCNLIVAHHPIVFSGLKSITGTNYIERVIVKAIKHDIAIYACHTNLDNNLTDGVNNKIAQKLGLKNLQLLQTKSNTLRKLVSFCPVANCKEVRAAMFNAGGGKLGNYAECSFNIEGYGTFKALPGADPHVGEIGEMHREEEQRIEIMYPREREKAIIKAMLDAHPYEEVAYDIYDLANTSSVGAGAIGELENTISEMELLKILKEKFNAQGIRYTKLLNKPISKIALCGGSGSFLLKEAINAQADVFISADFKYHQFFDADEKIVIMDIGHYETEQFTSEIFYEQLKKKFANFAVRFSKVNTNPINYY